MNFRRKKRDKFDISVIPMIDVFMVLLIFFMITTTFNRQSSLNIKLPEANSAPNEAYPKSITLSVDAKGDYYLADSEGVSRKLQDQQRDTLFRELNRLSENAKSIPFIINADGKTPHQSVMTALDVAGQAGFTHITFAAQEPQQKDE